MRIFNSTVFNILNQDHVDFFFLVKLVLHNDTRLMSSLPYDVILNITGTPETYIGNNALFEYDSPKFSSVVDREAYRLVLIDQVNYFSNQMKNNMVGKDIEVRVGFFENGVPNVDPNNLLFVYKGTIDRPSVQTNEDNKLAIIEGTSPMSDLDLVRSFMSSKQGIGQRGGFNNQGNPIDTSFNSLYDNKEIMVKWGKV